MTSKSVIIVGGGQAGATCAMALRNMEFSGDITIIGDEPHAPYERPELSKKLVSGECTLDSVTILDGLRARDLGIRLITGCTVQSIDRAARKVRTAQEDLNYDWLVVATGGRARTLDQASITGLPILTIRTADDARRLQQHLKPDAHVAIIGGGWLGLELAASCRKAGMEVDVIEASDRLCSRAAPPALSQLLLTLHVSQGVRIHCGEAISFQPDQVTVGKTGAITPDLVIIAIGMEANDFLAADAGLATNRGILVDADFQTADPHVFAIGDCALRKTVRGQSVRIESWQNANYSAQVAACSIVGVTPPPAEPLWFWSDQFDSKLQMVGDLSNADEIIERVSGPEDRMIFHFRNGTLVGIWAQGAARDFALARRWLAQGAHVSPSKLWDSGVPLKAALVA